MESQSDSRNGPVFNMENCPITEGQEIQRSDEKRANGIGNGEIQRRIKNIPVLEERRLLALERHIKCKRRRRPFVKKMKSSDKTEHHIGKTMAAPNGKMSDDPGAFELKDEVVQESEGEGKEDCSQNEIEGTRMAVSEKYEEKPNGLVENFVVQSPKMDVEEDKQQSVQFDKLVEYLLDGVKSEIIKTVEDELKNQSGVKQSKAGEEDPIKMDEGDVMEVKQEEENFTHVKEVNTSPPEDARHVNDEGLKKEKENFQDEGHKHLERAKDHENKIVDFGEEKAEHSFNASVSNTGSKEPTPKDPESEAAQTDQLFKEESDNFSVRNELALAEDEDDEDDDEGFMPRKLFFFSFSEFKKEETSA